MLSILLYFTENASVCQQLSCVWRADAQDREIMKTADRETTGLVRDMFKMTLRALKPTGQSSQALERVWGGLFGEAQSVHGIIKDALVEHASRNVESAQRFCSILDRSSCFSHCFHFRTGSFLDDEDHHTKHKSWWRDIWATLPPTMHEDALRAVWALMTHHNEMYKAAAATHTSWGALRRNDGTKWIALSVGAHPALRRSGGTRVRWGEHKMDRFAGSAFVWNEIAPLMLECLPALTAQHSLDAVKVEMRKVQWDDTRSLSFDVWRRTMSDICCMLDQEQQQRFLCTSRMLLDANEFAAQRFHRKHTAKRRGLKKEERRRAFRKYNGKSDVKRIVKKMEKFVLKFV